VLAAAAVSRRELIMAVFEVNSKGRPSRLADPNFDDFRDQNQLPGDRQVQRLRHVRLGGFAAHADGRRARVVGLPGRSFDVQPVLGREFASGDTKKGAPTVLVSDRYWRQHLGSRRTFAGAPKIDGAIFSVIGVLPAGFRFPAEADLWVPAELDGESTSRTSHNYSAVARLRDGVTVDQANRDISAIARRIHEESNEKGDYLLKDGLVMPLQDALTGQARPALLILLGAVGFLLLVACANVANLLLAQASASGSGARHPERARRGARTAGPPVPCRGVPARWPAARSGFSWRRGRRGTRRGRAGQSAAARERLDQHSRARLRFLPSTAVAAGLGAFTAVRATSGDLREGLGEEGAGRRARGEASAWAGSSWRPRSRSRWCSWWARGCSGAA
jgi:hypothetical protein